MLIIGISMTACTETVAEKAAEKAVESKTGGKVKIDSKKGSVEIKGKDGEIKIGANKLPDDFPDDLPIYKPSKIQTSMNNTIQGKKTYAATLSTEDGFEAVVDFYKKKLTDNGWTEASSFSSGEGDTQLTTLGYEKGDAIATVVISKADGQTQIGINHTPKL